MICPVPTRVSAVLMLTAAVCVTRVAWGVAQAPQPPAEKVFKNIQVLKGLEPYAHYLPSDGSTWESVVVNGVHWTSSGGIYGTLNGCFEAGDTELRAYV